MLANYAWYITLFTKEVDKVVHTYLVYMYSEFGGSHKVLLGNSTEFKNKFMHVASPLEMRQAFSFPCYSQGNGCN